MYAGTSKTLSQHKHNIMTDLLHVRTFNFIVYAKHGFVVGNYGDTVLLRTP